MLRRGRALAPTPAPAPVSPLVGVCVENSAGGVEVTAPVAMSSALFSPLPATASAESGEVSLSPSLEAAALPTTADLVTLQEWGDSAEPAGAGEVGWSIKPVHKRPLSGEHVEARGHKAAPSIPLDQNQFEVLAGSEEADYCTSMDLELASLLTNPNSWAADNILDSLGGVQTPPRAGDLGDLGGAGAP
ncbi:hypothetical protein AAFF_G00418920 [Aldrovandia affinis]|uniref:Uncharacterized protein n=1 Tax=Aldrovandia affinis TaxID=143900 RepID=A0AAD7S9Z7_9TELE|nr:hypothetical protein AAFF_G00418920 [Aldrovandia affinis]